MAVMFGNATVAQGNATSILSNSTLTFANGTRVLNGNSGGPFPFLNSIIINPGANGGNLCFVPAGNAAVAANIPFNLSLVGLGNVPFNIEAGTIAAANQAGCTGNSLVIGDANQVYFAAFAATFVTFEAD